MYAKNLKRLGMIAAISIIVMMFATHVAAEDEAEVGFDAPDWVIAQFAVNIKIDNIDTDDIKGMHGQFDISFDPEVINVTKVGPCNSNVEIIDSDLENSDEGTISVEFSVSTTKANRVLVEVKFDIVGDVGESCDLGISGSIYHRDGDEISAKWTGDTVNIGSFNVEVNAPDCVNVGGTFDATIDVTDIDDLNSGGFMLSFDSSVVNVTDVEPGKIIGTELPLAGWGFEKSNKVKVLFKLPGENGLSGSGTLATISFAVIGEDGDSSVLDIDEDTIHGLVITNTESDLLPINWIDTTVTIDSAAPPPPNETDTYVYVKNPDDDKLIVFLFIDGDFIIDKDVLSGSTKKYSSYKLLEGLHTFKIRWYDLDTDEWHETIKEYSVSGETDLVVINTEEHVDEDTQILAHVYVKNLDDDDVTVYLYIDDKYKKYELIEFDDTCEYETDGYEFDEEGVRSFKIKWRDPDTEEEYEKVTREYIKTEELITLYVDKHTEEEIITTESVSNPVSTPSTAKSDPAPTTSAKSDTSSPLQATTPTTVMSACPVQNDGNGVGHGITTLYTLIGAVAIVFAMMRIRRI